MENKFLLLKGTVDVVDQPLYDTKLYTAGCTRLDFFASSIGLTDHITQEVTTLEDTNMWISGFLPHGCAFTVHGVALDIGRGGSKLLHGGSAELLIGSKICLQVAPLQLLARYKPRTLQVDGSDMRKNNYAPFQLNHPLLIDKDTPFKFQLRWKKPPVIKKPIPIRIELVGDFYRPVY